MRILKHAVAVMRPRGGVFDLDVDDDVLRSMAGFLEYLPAPTRLSFPLGLRLLEYGPFLFREGFRTFSSMDEETATRYLHHWERAGSAPSLLYQGVRALVFVCFYQHPRILEAMEVDWQGRADDRVKFRARIMRDQILRSAVEAGARAEAEAAARDAEAAAREADAATEVGPAVIETEPVTLDTPAAATGLEVAAPEAVPAAPETKRAAPKRKRARKGDAKAEDTNEAVSTAPAGDAS